MYTFVTSLEKYMYLLLFFVFLLGRGCKGLKNDMPVVQVYVLKENASGVSTIIFPCLTSYDVLFCFLKMPRKM